MFKRSLLMVSPKELQLSRITVQIRLTSAKVDQFVDRFVKDNSFALLRSKLGNVLQRHETISVGSCCTGWGCLEMLLRELEPAWNAEHSGWDVKARS